MSKTSIRFVRSDQKTFAIDGSIFGLTAAKGLDEPNIEVFTQKSAVGDGDIVTGQRVGSRTLEFTCKIRNPALNDTMRRFLTSFFVAAKTYDVYVKRSGAQRFAQACRLEGLTINTENQYKPITAKVSMLMPDGYFLSVDSFGRNIAGVEDRCGYPYIATAAHGRIYGLYSFAQTVYLDNDGDAEAYCKAVFTAKGTVTNPKMIAGDGYVRVLTTLSDGDVMIIDGKAKSVTINGANASNLQDKRSNYDGIVFALGTNSIGFSADVGSNVLDVYVYYNKRYLGA